MAKKKRGYIQNLTDAQGESKSKVGAAKKARSKGTQFSNVDLDKFELDYLSMIINTAKGPEQEQEIAKKMAESLL